MKNSLSKESSLVDITKARPSRHRMQRSHAARCEDAAKIKAGSLAQLAALREGRRHPRRRRSFGDLPPRVSFHVDELVGRFKNAVA